MALAAGCLITASSVLVHGLPASASAGLQFLRYWPHHADEVVFVVDDNAQRFVGVKNVEDDFTDLHFDVTVYKPDGSVDGTPHHEPNVLAGADFGLGSPAVYTFDETTHTLYLITYPAVPGPSPARLASATPQLMAFDTSNPSAIRKVFAKPIPAFPAAARILGMRFDAAGKLYAVAQVDAGVRAYTVLVAELDATSNASAVVPTMPPVPVRGCQRVIATFQPAAVVHAGDSVFIGCAPSSDPSQTNPIGLGASIQEVNLKDPSASRSYFLPGTYVKGESFVDNRAGSAGRLVLVGSALLRPGQAVWVFDMKERKVIAQIAASQITGTGINSQTGHIFVASPAEILLGSDRGMPVPGALPPISLDGLDGSLHSTTDGRVIAARFNNTVMVPIPKQNETSNWVEYAIFKDLTTDADLPPGSLQDWNGADNSEAGTDTPDYQAGAQGFGFRVRQLGGVGNLRSNLDGASPDWWNDPIFGSISEGAPGIDSPAKITGIDDGDRDLRFGRVESSSLSADEAAAISTTASADERTRADYVSVTKKQKNIQKGNIDPREADLVKEDPKISGDSWPFGKAQCGQFSASDKPDSQDSKDNASWDSSPAANSTCDLKHNDVRATSQFNGLPNTGPVTVGFSRAEIHLEKTADGGVQAVSEAEARNIRIGTVVHIGRVYSRAVAKAFGGYKNLDGKLVAKGSNALSYSTEFEEVTTPGFSCQSPCDPKTVQHQLTEALEQVSDAAAVQVQVDLPPADTFTSEGGAHAHVWREPWDLQQDVLLNSQDPNDAEVPALRISVISDSDLPSRTILEFAATEADATHTRLHEVPPEAPVPPDSNDGSFVQSTPSAQPGPLAPVDAVSDAGPAFRTIEIAGRSLEKVAATEAAQADVGLQNFLQQLKKGARWILGRALPVFGLTLAVWGLFGIPPFLAARRRHLLRLAKSSAAR